MSWTDTFPVFSSHDFEAPDKIVFDQNRRRISELFEVSEKVRFDDSNKIISTSLSPFDIDLESADLIEEAPRESVYHSRETILPRIARFKGICRLLNEANVDFKIRVYLDPRLINILDDLLALGLQIYIMKNPAVGKCPGALWKYLAFESQDSWVTTANVTQGTDMLANVERTQMLNESGLDFWRIPGHISTFSQSPAYYRPISSGVFGGKGGLPITDILESFVRAATLGLISPKCLMPLRHFPDEDLTLEKATWPLAGFEDWFLMSAMYPRIVSSRILTLYPIPTAIPTPWLGLDIEYATWANNQSELLFFYSRNTKKIMRFERMKMAGAKSILRKLK